MGGDFTLIVVDADEYLVRRATVYTHTSGLVSGVTDSVGRKVFNFRYLMNLNGVFALTINDISKKRCVYASNG